MPTPRMSNQIARAAATTGGKSPNQAAWHKAIVIGVFGEMNNRVYVKTVDGVSINPLALAVIDAPLKVGDWVYITFNATAGEWIIMGTA